MIILSLLIWAGCMIIWQESIDPVVRQQILSLIEGSTVKTWHKASFLEDTYRWCLMSKTDASGVKSV